MAQTKEKQTAVIRLPLNRNQKEDVYVAVNGHAYLIQRGQEVTVPIAVAKVLEQKEAMLQTAFDYEQSVAAKQ